MNFPTDFLVETFLLRAPASDGSVVIDCRKLEEYQEGHIPGAVVLPIDYWLKEKDGSGVARGVHLIDQSTFEEIMGSLGVDRGTPLVTYDDNQGRGACRVSWVLRYFGHERIRVLNGGWRAWLNDNREMSRDQEVSVARSYRAFPQSDLLVSLYDLLNHLGDYQIVDARSLEEYVGSDIHGNSRAGRIPGAVHVEWCSFISDEPRTSFRSMEELRDIVFRAGLLPERPTVTYCQSGVRAAHVAFVLQMLDFRDVKVFDGSMREWSAHPATPMAFG